MLVIYIGITALNNGVFMRVRIKKVLENNKIFLKDVLNNSVEEFLLKMTEMGPSSVFKKLNRNYNWIATNPTEGWCGQMTRFLKDYQLIPDGYSPCCNDDKYHYYLVSTNNDFIDLTIYQMIDYKNISDDDVIEYDCNKAKFNPVRTKSTKDAMKLAEKFL
jgi:hypothetical protein